MNLAPSGRICTDTPPTNRQVRFTCDKEAPCHTAITREWVQVSTVTGVRVSGVQKVRTGDIFTSLAVEVTAIGGICITIVIRMIL